MSRTLVIVDMQTGFDETAHRCKEQVIREVKRAKRRGAGIVVLEYTGDFFRYGRTYLEIRKLLKGYGRKTFAKKRNDDGSKECIRAANRNGFPLDKVRVVGVNRSYCVWGTIDGLRRKIKTDIQVMMDATCCHDPADGERWLRRNCKVV